MLCPDGRHRMLGTAGQPRTVLPRPPPPALGKWNLHVCTRFASSSASKILVPTYMSFWSFLLRIIRKEG